MKTIYQLFFLILLLAPISIFSQDVTYTFDAGGNGYTSDAGATYTNMVTYGTTPAGNQEIKTLAQLGAATAGDGNTTNVFHGISTGISNAPTGVFATDLSAIASSTNQQIIWKAYLKTATTASKGVGVILRGQSSASGYATGARQGYHFSCYGTTTSGTVTFRVGKLDGTTGYANIKAATNLAIAGFTNGPLYLKAKIVGSLLYFEYSTNGITFTSFAGSPYTDITYSSGVAQLAWGLGSGSNTDEYFDDVQYWDLTKNVTLSGSKFMYDGTAKTPTIAKTGFTTPIETIAYNGISGTSYGPSEIAPSATGTYLMTVSEVEGVTRTASQVFTILPATFDKIYTFESDAIGTAAALTTTSTGANVTGGHTVQLFSGATEGGYSVSTKTLSIAAGAANTRAISSLDDFGTTSTDYAVTWKEYNTTASANKHVVVLRADATTNNSFYSPSSNYRPQGQGYGFLVNPTGASAVTLQIYKLNLLDTWANLTGATVSLTTFPVQGVPLWFRASVFGSSTVLLKFEYSIDGTNWVTATTAVDDSTPVASGATHVFGVNSNNQNYYFDYFGSKTITELTTSIGNTNTDKNKMYVTVKDKMVTVANATNFEVYNIQGMKVKEVRSNTTNHSIALSSGIYFIRSGNFTLKAIVK